MISAMEAQFAISATLSSRRRSRVIAQRGPHRALPQILWPKAGLQLGLEREHKTKPEAQELVAQLPVTSAAGSGGADGELAADDSQLGERRTREQTTRFSSPCPSSLRYRGMPPAIAKRSTRWAGLLAWDRWTAGGRWLLVGASP